MSEPTTSAVTALRTATAVATSTPWSKATRAATWLAPIRRAMRRRVANAAIDRAVGVARSLIDPLSGRRAEANPRPGGSAAAMRAIAAPYLLGVRLVAHQAAGEPRVAGMVALDGGGSRIEQPLRLVRVSDGEMCLRQAELGGDHVVAVLAGELAEASDGALHRRNRFVGSTREHQEVAAGLRGLDREQVV